MFGSAIVILLVLQLTGIYSAPATVNDGVVETTVVGEKNQNMQDLLDQLLDTQNAKSIPEKPVVETPDTTYTQTSSNEVMLENAQLKVYMDNPTISKQLTEFFIQTLKIYNMLHPDAPIQPAATDIIDIAALFNDPDFVSFLKNFFVSAPVSDKLDITTIVQQLLNQQNPQSPASTIPAAVPQHLLPENPVVNKPVETTSTALNSQDIKIRSAVITTPTEIIEQPVVVENEPVVTIEEYNNGELSSKRTITTGGQPAVAVNQPILNTPVFSTTVGEHLPAEKPVDNKPIETISTALNSQDNKIPSAVITAPTEIIEQPVVVENEPVVTIEEYSNGELPSTRTITTNGQPALAVNKPVSNTPDFSTRFGENTAAPSQPTNEPSIFNVESILNKLKTPLLAQPTEEERYVPSENPPSAVIRQPGYVTPEVTLNTPEVVNNFPVSPGISTSNEWSNVSPHNNDEELKQQAKNAKYQFAYEIDDGINDNFQQRAEIRQNGVVSGKYAYDDGFFWRSTYYEADENGFRITKKEVAPSRITIHTGEANVRSLINGDTLSYHITENETNSLKAKQRVVPVIQ